MVQKLLPAGDDSDLSRRVRGMVLSYNMSKEVLKLFDYSISGILHAYLIRNAPEPGFI